MLMVLPPSVYDASSDNDNNSYGYLYIASP